MVKGSVRKKGKKWYYRFYVEDASGKTLKTPVFSRGMEFLTEKVGFMEQRI